MAVSVRMRLAPPLLLAVVTAGAFAATTASVDATFPGANGVVVFDSNRDAQREIYAMPGATNLTNHVSADLNPAVSADGTRIAFVSNRDGNNEIYVMNADGSGQARLTNNGAMDEDPAFMPDGRIVFESNRDGNFEVYVMDAAGSGLDNLTENPAFDSDPSVSPDGSKVVFRSDRDGDGEIFTMSPTGASQAPLTANATDDFDPAYSPTGSSITFTSNRDGDDEIFTMGSGGGGETPLTANAFSDGDPVFSPDGTLIAFESNRDGNNEIYTMPATGGAATNLTNNAASDVSPDWQATTAAPPPDTTPPDAEVSGTKNGKSGLGRKVVILIACGIENCIVEIDGVLKIVRAGELRKVERVKAAKAKQYELKTVTAQVAANVEKRVKLKLPKKGYEAASEALAGNGKASLKLSATATDAAGNEDTAAAKVKLKD